MKIVTKNQPSQGFSLVELLLAVAIMSMLAAVAMVAYTNIKDAAETAKSKQNAQAICHLYEAARAVGAVFTSTTKEGILEELIEGRSGKGAFAMSVFKLSLRGREKAAALARCSFDPRTAIMQFSTGRGRAADE